MGLFIVVGDLCCAIKTHNSTLLKELRQRYKNFISVKKKKPILAIDIKQDVNSVSHKNVSPKELSTEIKSFYNNIFEVKLNELMGEINLESGVALVRGDVNFYAIDSFLRIAYSLLSIKESGFLVHSAGIIKDNKGYVFAGPSGSGKSTITKLVDNGNILSDETVLIKQNTNEFDFYGTPFSGDVGIGQNLCARIDKLFILKKIHPTTDKETGIYSSLKLSQSEAIKELLKNVIFFTQEIELNRKLLKLCYEFCCKVEVREISFMPNKLFLKEIEKT